MAEFERPKAKALSDSELARRLQTFPSDANGLEQAGRLMAEQQVLREQDSQELQAWIEFLKARDDLQSRRILAESMASIFPAEPIEQVATPPEPAVLTSQLPVITRKSRVSNRLRGGQIQRLVATATLLSVANALVLQWLNISNWSAVAASSLGLAVALTVSTTLRSHLLHPILRAAAVFGGYGVYVFAALILGSTSLFYISAFKGESELVELASVGPYSAILIVLVSTAALLGQLVPARYGSLLILLSTLGAAAMLVSQELVFDPNAGLQPGWHWGAAAVALFSSVILLVGSPHTKVSWKDAGWLFPTTVLLVAALVSLAPLSLELAAPIAVLALMLGLVYSGRDLAGGGLGRLAGLSLLIGLILSPLHVELSGTALSLLSAALMLMLLDQVFRTSPLHVASLDTSYGFYGAASVTGWMGLILAGTLGTTFFTDLLPDTFNHLEWSLVAGLSIGLIFGLIRIPVIRRQDREIKNLDSSSGNIENLLGL